MESAKEALKTLLENGFIESYEKTCLVKDNKRLIINMSASLMPDKQRFLISVKDITDMKKHEKELEYIAHYDPLTGLLNRVLKSDRLHQAILQVNRKEGYLAVVYLDLDGFKEVNDKYGHGVGDQLLVGVETDIISVSCGYRFFFELSQTYPCSNFKNRSKFCPRYA
jgi:predicted signal transduction protein with EAL and GGDEF domain